MSLATCWHFSVRGLRLVDTNQASCCVKQTTSIIAGLPPSVNSVRLVITHISPLSAQRSQR